MADDAETEIIPVQPGQRAGERPWLLPAGKPGRAGGGGMVGVLIVGAIALVVALMALTIAIGRAPQNAAANPQPEPNDAAAAGPTSFYSPKQTGKRWTPEPIITGVPQNEASYEGTPSESRSVGSTPEAGSSASGENEDEDEQTHQSPQQGGVIGGGYPGGHASAGKPTTR